MRIELFVGDIAEAPAEAICTSTNPRLSLMMGTGGSVRERGGFEVLRACEAIVEAEAARSGNLHLPLGSVHVTTAGRLPFKAVIHCIASDAAQHRSSPEVVRFVVKNALRAADKAGCASVAMPVFGTGHARLKFDESLAAMAAALRGATTNVQKVLVVISDPERVPDVQRIFPQLV